MNSSFSSYSPEVSQNSRSRYTPLNRSVSSPSARKSLRINATNKSIQSINQTILKSHSNYIQRFGQPLPVLITEGLTFSERNTVVSAKISNCGYAWLVCGRRLLIWQYRQNMGQSILQKKHVVTGQCFELQLPHSDLAHRAELVSVFMNPGTHFPSCIAVSPEGIVRYWPAVNYEGVSIEQVVDLQGQECDSLTNVDGFGYILATTTCTVVLIQPQNLNGRHVLNCRPLKTPSGWLGGLSKRMSSLIFGSITSEQSIETRLIRILTVPIDENSWFIYVLAGHSLQKWKLSSNGQEQLIFVAELNRLVSDGFLLSAFETCTGDQSDMDTWLLDIQSDKENIILLAAAVNMHVSSQVHYAMICIQTNTTVPPTNFQDFLLLQITGLYRDEDPSDCLSYRFLLSGSTAYVYNQKSITVIKPQEEPDVLDFDGPHDFLLCGSICKAMAIFFSRNHGLISVCSNDDLGVPDMNLTTTTLSTQMDIPLMSDTVIGNLSLYTLDPEELISAYKDTLGQLKAAFIFHVQNEMNSCREILQQLFFSDATFIAGTNAVLDTSVIQVCEDILNDVPASDPRWSNTSETGLGSSYSVQVLKQLEDKQKALTLFFKFLNETQLWERLSAVTVHENILCTVYVLGDLAEKVIAAITLKNISNDDILEKCIGKTIGDSDDLENGLTHQDLFFREVTKIARGLQQINIYSEEVANSAQSPSAIAETIRRCNELLLHVLKTVIQYRQARAENFIPMEHAKLIAPDYLPWTILNNSSGLYGTIFAQQSLTYNYAIKYASNMNVASTLYDQMVCLIDIILDGLKSHMESIKGSEKEELLRKQYERDRFQLINQLVINKQWDCAAVLGEKYLDFKILVIICESTDNQQRLDEYMDRFSNEGFSKFVYGWYMQENKQAKLINRCRKIANASNKTLYKFLSEHPSLSWMKDVFNKNFDGAAETLNDLALHETESVGRKKTMLSLSKLAKLAASNGPTRDDFIDETNRNLELIEFQEEIPDYVLEEFGYDTVKPAVISPIKLIHLYICPEYRDSTELEFKKALDLIRYITDYELKTNLKLKIWRMAILKDSWNEKNVDSPLDVLQNKVFYKLADLAIMLGEDPEVLLPPLDILIDSDELSSLQENKSFLFLIKAAYECIYTK
ncbi:putative nuclear pore complex protein [Trypoxylus dichotomus]